MLCFTYGSASPSKLIIPPLETIIPILCLPRAPIPLIPLYPFVCFAQELLRARAGALGQQSTPSGTYPSGDASGTYPSGTPRAQKVQVARRSRWLRGSEGSEGQKALRIQQILGAQNPQSARGPRRPRDPEGQEGPYGSAGPEGPERGGRCFEHRLRASAIRWHRWFEIAFFIS